MATSCEDNNWFWVYFTSVNNIAKCDICYTSFQITEVPKDNIMRHIETKHSVDYQRIVSSGNSQKDLESQLYIIQNNDITCKYCDSIFYATNNSYSLINHLKTTHKIKKDEAAKICKLLRNNYLDESDTDMKRRCSSCNETILNKPLVLMSHLSKVHKINVPLISEWKWVWAYYTRNKNLAKCSVCSNTYVAVTNILKMINHIKVVHNIMSDVSQENSQAYENWPYSIIEDNRVKCDNCDESYVLIFYASKNMKTHLAEKHNLNEDIARKLCNWVLEYFHISNLQTSKCSRCENVFKKSNFFNLMIHLKKAHQICVPPEIIPARLSSELNSLLNPDRWAENNAPSSSYNQPSRNVDQSSDRDNLYDEIDNSSEMKTTRLLTSKNWIWAYYTRNTNLAKCSVCNKTYSAITNILKMINHIKMVHGIMSDVSENSRTYEDWPYSIIEDNRVKCDNCDESYVLIFYVTKIMKTHLAEKHNLNEDIARKLCNWVLEYFHISNLQTSKCNRCENVFQKSNFFNLMIHSKKAHQICVPPEIIPARLSSELSSLFNSDRWAENNAPSTSYNQSPRNVDQSSDCDNHYVQIDNCSEIKTTSYKKWRQSRYY